MEYIFRSNTQNLPVRHPMRGFKIMFRVRKKMIWELKTLKAGESIRLTCHEWDTVAKKLIKDGVLIVEKVEPKPLTFSEQEPTAIIIEKVQEQELVQEADKEPIAEESKVYVKTSRRKKNQDSEPEQTIE